MPVTELAVFGPFPLPFDRGRKGSAKQITKAHVKEFWQREELKEMGKKHGCYIFAMKAGRGYTPWYVGKATKNLKQECLTDNKRVKYNEVLFTGLKGTPVLFFVARPLHLVKIATPVLSNLEEFLIQNASFKNPDIKNVQNVKAPNWMIQGVVRRKKGAESKTAKSFRLMLGI